VVTAEELQPWMHSEICALLAGFHDPALAREDWLRLLTFRCACSERKNGFVLIDQGHVAGFIGTIFSQRTIDARERSVCQICCWILHERYRSRGLARLLLEPVTAQPDTTLVVVIPGRRTTPIFREAGFVTLESRFVVLSVGRHRDSSLSRRQLSVVHDHTMMNGRLDERDARLVGDHDECRHVVLQTSRGESCLVIYTVARSNAPSHLATIHYVSHPELFARGAATVAEALLARHATNIVAVDERLTRGIQIAGGLVCTRRIDRLFRSDALAAAQVDNLYSELSILNSSAH